MYVWNVADEDGPVCIFRPTQSGQLDSPVPTSCAIHQSGWGVVGNSSGKFNLRKFTGHSHVILSLG